MAGDDRVRFCSECGKNVYNIAEMREDETLALAAEREGRLCVRYFERADGTVITSDCPAVFTRVRRRVLKTFAALAASPLWAQAGKGRIEGIVTDQTGAAIPSAQITLAPASGTWASTKSGPDGRWSMPEVESGAYSLRIAVPGFRSHEQDVVVKSSKTLRMDATLEIGSTGGATYIEPTKSRIARFLNKLR